MSNKNYTPDQIEELLKNQYVAKCSSKYITYTIGCKEKAVQIYQNEYMSSREIFRSFGFPSYIVESVIPKNTIKAWRKIVLERGFIGLREGKKGRKKKVESPGNNPPMTETTEYLKAKIAYLEEENNFLRLLRAQRK